MMEEHHAAATAAEQENAEVALRNEIETMRVAMPREQFEAYMRKLESRQAAEGREMVKVAAMSATQQYRYRQQQRRRKMMYEYYKTVIMLLAVLGSTGFLFFFFFFFE